MKTRLRSWIGLCAALVFAYLAVRSISLDDLLSGFRNADYRYLLPCVALTMLGHVLRAVRWQFLLLPMRFVPFKWLFSSLMIGYVVNSITPAHLGELVRAYVLGKREGIPASAVLASIVVERIVDVLSLLALMFLSVFIYPFPSWVTASGYMMLAGSLILMGMLASMRRYPDKSLKYMQMVLKFLPVGIGSRLLKASEGFISGITPLKHAWHYPFLAVVTAAIWACYGLILYLCLHAFGFAEAYGTGWVASLLLLIITTIAVVVPSSPGYVGTYHYLCQLTLGMFSVPAGPALSFAAVVHLVNMLPVTLAGVLCARVEGMAIFGKKNEAVHVLHEKPQSQPD